MKNNRILSSIWIFTILTILYLIWLSKTALIPFFIGGIIAYMIKPLTSRVAKWIKKAGINSEKLTNALSIIFIYGFLAILTMSSLLIIGDGIANQVAQLNNELPILTEKARIEFFNILQKYHNQVPMSTQIEIDNFLSDFSMTVTNAIGQLSKSLISYLTNTIAILFGFLLTPFWIFYVLRDNAFNRKKIISITPKYMQKDLEFILHKFEKIVSNYYKGQFLLAFIVGITISLCLSLINIPMSFALGIIAGITELIPVIGPWIALIPAILIVLSFDPSLLPAVIFIYFIVQFIENLILVPKIHSGTIDVQPAMILLLLIISGYIFGFIGLLIALPTYAFIKEMLIYATKRLS